MSNEEQPPLEFDGEFDGYDSFNPREFWERVRSIDRECGVGKSTDQPAKTDEGTLDGSTKPVRN